MPKKHETASVSGAYIKLQTAVLKALPRDIDDDACLELANSGDVLKQYLSLLPTLLQSKSDKPAILRLISGGQSLVIGPTNGTRTLVDASDVFPGGIDSDFRNWDASGPSGPTPETPVEVFELVKDATFEQMFSSVADELDRLCFTEDQIIEFVQTHPSWLRTGGYGTFFPYKRNRKFFVAYVGFHARVELDVSVYKLGYDYVWDAGYRHRVVRPQL